MPKYYRAVTAKPKTLVARYGKCDGRDDIVFANGDGTDRTDKYVLMNAFHLRPMDIDNEAGCGFKFSNSLITELERRGYDIKTLKFSIEKKREYNE
jgi:hypothetical protein